MSDLTTKAAEIRAGLVKPLEWRAYPDDGTTLSEGQNARRRYLERAMHPYGAYFLMEKDGRYSVKSSTCGFTDEPEFATPDLARADAEAKHVANVLSALNLALIEQQAAELAEARRENERSECGRHRLGHAVREAERARDDATADLIRWRSAFQRVTPGGSEFFDPQAVREWADKLKTDVFEANKRAILSERRATTAESERDELLREKERLGAGWLPIETVVDEMDAVGRTGAEMITRHRFHLHADNNCAEIDSHALAEEIDAALASAIRIWVPSDASVETALAAGLRNLREHDQPGQSLDGRVARAIRAAIAALAARSVLEDGPAGLADAHSKSPAPSSQSERIAVPCPHAPTYDAGLCCGHPDDCTFVRPSGLYDGEPT